MLSLLGRRGLEAGISAFALLGFCYVPLGQRTGLEHAKAVFSTPAAKRAGDELMLAFTRIRSKLTAEATPFASPEPTPPSSAQPSPRRSGGVRADRGHSAAEPKPRLPRLGPESNAHATPQEPLPNFGDPNAPDASASWHES